MITVAILAIAVILIGFGVVLGPPVDRRIMAGAGIILALVALIFTFVALGGQSGLI